MVTPQMFVKLVSSGAQLQAQIVGSDDSSAWSLGDDGDVVFFLRSTALGANTALSGVLVGTPVTPALAADSAIISNTTEDGDILFAVRDGDHSKGLLHLDGSAGSVTIVDNLTFDGTDLTIASGSIEVRTIDYSDGDNAMTIADGGGVTFAQATTFDGGITNSGTIAAGTWNGTDVGVAYGGTGVSTLTDGGILLGSGASAITAMAVLTDGQMIVGDGTTDPVAESGTVLRTSIGVGTGDSPQFTNLTLTGDLAVNGTDITSTGALTLNPATNFNVTLTANYSQAMIWNDGATNIYYLDTRDETPALITHYIKSQNVVLEDAANAVHQAFEIGTYSVTLEGQTTVLTPQRSVNIEATQLRATGGNVTVTEAVTFRIAGAPYSGTADPNLVTITNNYALKVDSGTSRFDGDVDLNSTGTLLHVGGSGNNFTASGITVASSADSSAAADQVTFGRYDIGAGNTVIALSQETAVASDTDETKFSHKMQVRINGSTYYMMLTSS